MSEWRLKYGYKAIRMDKHRFWLYDQYDAFIGSISSLDEAYSLLLKDFYP